MYLSDLSGLASNVFDEGGDCAEEKKRQEKYFFRPVTFTPSTHSSPSKEDNWKKDMELSDVKLETNVSKAEVQTKDKQEEFLLQKIKGLKDSIIIYKEQMKESEDLYRANLKIVKSTLQVKVDEKEKLIKHLRLFIDEAQCKIQQLSTEHGGEGAEVSLNFSNSLQPLIMQVVDLQDEKINLVEKLSIIEKELATIKRNYTSLEETLKIEYVRKSDFDLLLTENMNLKRKLMVVESNRHRVLSSEVCERRDKKIIEEDLSSATNHQVVLNLQDSLHLKKFKEYEDEISRYKKKLRDIESKCTSLLCTPPKVQVRKVKDNDFDKEFYQLKEENHQQNLKLEVLKKELSDVRNSRELILSDSRDLELNKKKMHETITVLENQISHLSLLQVKNENDLAASKKKCEEKENEIEMLVKDFNDRQQLFQKDMSYKVNQAIASSKQSYDKKEKTLHNFLKRFSAIRGQLDALNQDKIELKTMVANFKILVQPSFLCFRNQLCKAVFDVSERSQILAKQYKKEIILRKKLHNQLVELKGNIRVFCRVRSLIQNDGVKDVLSYDDLDDAVIILNHKNTNHHFKMDKVFRPTATQEEVFMEVDSLVTSCLDGYNVCIFAYGQTGSGKTYTMEGTENNPGINQRALGRLFDESAQNIDWEYTIVISYMEIYNEMLRDLLSPNPTAKLDIKQSTDGLSVSGLTILKVHSVNDINEILALGRCNRMTAATDVHERSSRSHSILIVTISRKNLNTGITCQGKMSLIDLAGSERISKSGVEGLRLKEAQSINKSLLALGDVIQSLKTRKQHIPYRNSKLTYLLQDSLGGNSKTLMVVQVSPVDKNSGETFCSLNFAHRTRSVVLGPATARQFTEVKST